MVSSGNIFDNKKVLLFLKRNADYSGYVSTLLKRIPQNKKICYVSLYKSYEFILEILKKDNISPSNFYFIDCVSSFIKTPSKKIPNVDFVSAPYELEEIAVAIKKAIIKGNDLIIFDSISALFHYGVAVSAGTGRLMNFIKSFEKELSEKKGSAIFIIRDEDREKTFLQESLPAFEKVMKL